jgi:hypothetical protein
MRRSGVVVGGVGVMLLLSSCSVPAEWAARLNDDGTIDYLDCYSDLDHFEVDFRMPDESYLDESPEWQAEIDNESVSGMRSASVEVAYYGELPDGWIETVRAARSPGAWTFVSTNAGFAERDDLVEGEWVWFTNDDNWAWIPPQPCDGWELGPDGEPRRI